MFSEEFHKDFWELEVVMKYAESGKTEEEKSHKKEVQRKPDEATSRNGTLVLQRNGLSDEGLEAFLDRFALEEPGSDKVLLYDLVANEGDDGPI